MGGKRGPDLTHLSSRRTLAAGRLEIRDFFGVNPRFDLLLRDAKTDTVPALGIEALDAGGFVFRGIIAINAGQADDAAAPTADNQGAEGVAHRESQPAEKVRAIQLHGLQRDFVIDLG